MSQDCTSWSYSSHVHVSKPPMVSHLPPNEAQHLRSEFRCVQNLIPSTILTLFSAIPFPSLYSGQTKILTTLFYTKCSIFSCLCLWNSLRLHCSFPPPSIHPHPNPVQPLRPNSMPSPPWSLLWFTNLMVRLQEHFIYSTPEEWSTNIADHCSWLMYLLFSL